MIVSKREDGYVQMAEGIHRQNLTLGELTHQVRFILETRSEVPLHSHEHEQTGYLLHGKMIMTVAGVSHELEDGSCWTIKSNVPHGVKVTERCEVIEVFAPPRNDYLD
jgi:quercetin dioxygenase-like cupin family protein